MIQLDEGNVRTYLEARFGGSARILGISLLGQEAGAHDVKGYGYGVPLKIEYELSGQHGTAVLETVTPGPFGHEHMADRAQILLWSH
ncbi:MAG: aminoglycoside phosphotransferase family protein, partial [Vicinamibacterales bacterium]